jgi:FAD binding domain
MHRDRFEIRSRARFRNNPTPTPSCIIPTTRRFASAVSYASIIVQFGDAPGALLAAAYWQFCSLTAEAVLQSAREVHPMISAGRSDDVVILGSGIAGLAGALAAHTLGLQPVVLEKAARLGGGTVHSYGLIWVGQNHLAQAAGHSDTRDEVLAYMRFLGGGKVDDGRLTTFVDRSPEALKFFERCGVSFRIVRGVTDHYYDKARAPTLSGGPSKPI